MAGVAQDPGHAEAHALRDPRGVPECCWRNQGDLPSRDRPAQHSSGSIGTPYTHLKPCLRLGIHPFNDDRRQVQRSGPPAAGGYAQTSQSFWNGVPSSET